MPQSCTFHLNLKFYNEKKILYFHPLLRGVSSWCDGLRDRLRNCSKRVRIPVALLRSLSGKYPWERYEPPYPPIYGINSTTTVLLGECLMALNNLQMPLSKKTKPYSFRSNILSINQPLRGM